MTTDQATIDQPPCDLGIDLGDAIRAAFISWKVPDAKGEAVNVVDAIDSVARTIWALGVEGMPASAGMITESINNAGVAIASAIRDLADAVWSADTDRPAE